MVVVLITNNNINVLTMVKKFVGFYIKNGVVESIVNGFGWGFHPPASNSTRECIEHSIAIVCC